MRKEKQIAIRLDETVLAALKRAAKSDRIKDATYARRLIEKGLIFEGFLKESAEEAEENVRDEDPSKKPITAKELLAVLEKSGLVGMWKDRTDIGDSREYARQLREKVEKRAKD